MKSARTTIEVGETYIFTKSGNRVTVIQTSGNGVWGENHLYLVKRVDTGKEMMVPDIALVPVGYYDDED